MTAKVGEVGTDIGVEFRTINCLTDVEEALPIDDQTTLEILFLKPDGTTLTVTAVFTPNNPPVSCGTADGTDGKATFFTLAGTLDQAGQWQYQGHVIKPSGEWWTDRIKFDVEARIV